MEFFVDFFVKGFRHGFFTKTIMACQGKRGARTRTKTQNKSTPKKQQAGVIDNR
jgi:hypothetical protein